MVTLFFLLFLFGTIVGSFLNVCVCRLPKEESIVWPGSHCPHCNQLIHWYDNIPLLSFLLLRGKCRFCHKKISWRYPLIEFIAGLIPVWVVSQKGFGWEAVIFAILFWGLIIVTSVDFEHQIIPDEISIGGLILAVLASLLYPSIHGVQEWFQGGRSALLGAVAGAGSIYAMGEVGRLIFRKEAMGMGDVKLMGMLGALLGWKQVLLIFFIAPFFGAVVGLAVKYLQKTDIIPYGPFLSLAAFVVVFWGDSILRYLMRY